MKIGITQVDAFTDRPFSGNPAAICVLDAPADESWMRNVAMEMNLSETAFVRFLDRSTALLELRWFTPTDEVKLCGHATLATAHHLFEKGLLAPMQIANFETLSGRLTARKLEGAWIELDFPAIQIQEAREPAPLARAFKVPFTYLGRGANGYEVIEVKDAQVLRTLRPETSALTELAQGLIVTASSDLQDVDFVSRFFSWHDGVGEDPVTGSAHCILAPLWGARLGKRQMTGFQASRRGGTVKVELQGQRVKLRGQAVTVLDGVITT